MLLKRVTRLRSGRTTACAAILLAILFATAAFADTVILHDGSSYGGRLEGLTGNQVSFTDNTGVQYTFPVADVQSLVFTPSSDTVTLRNGKSYSGHYTGASPISFMGGEGISYRFPLKDVASIVFTRNEAAPVHRTDHAIVIPSGTEISVRTDGAINSQDASSGELYPASISGDVFDSDGGVAIPNGARAKLVVHEMTSGGAVHSPELVLDLFSVDVNGRIYRVETSNVDYSNKRGVGANRRTAEFAGGGAGLGALMGAIFGGGKGAAIGAGTGAAGGLVTQLFTRGKKIQVPAETLLTFSLERTLVLRPGQ